MDCHTRIIAPSLLAADWAKVGDEVKRAKDAGADWLHLDVMDGNFVDNISFGPQMVKAIRPTTDLFLDVHLMIHRPDHYLDRFIGAGAENISIHVECRYDTGIAPTLARIREAGIGAGLVINPATPLSEAEPFFDQIDLLLVMTVVPGFGGQAFMEDETMPKLAEARDKRDAAGQSFHLQVDGGIDTSTAGIAARNGANSLVAGSASFGAPDMAAAVAAMRSAT